MENASKALIMAGGVLIAILLLTLFAYVIKNMGENTAGMYEELEIAENNKFNQKFLNYAGRGVDTVYDKDGNAVHNPLTIQDVVSIINLAKDSNKSDKRPIITVKVDNANWTDKDTIQLLQENGEKQYKCASTDIKINDGLVYEVYITTYNE